MVANTGTRNGRFSATPYNEARTCTCALLSTLWFSVHPVAILVTVNVKQNSPRGLPPSCQTRSISTKPEVFSS